jgi:hypothetical protein
MKKLSLSVITLSTVAVLSLGLTGCGNKVTSTPEPMSSVSASPTVSLARSSAGQINIAATELALQNEKKFTENNVIVTGEKTKFTVSAAGDLATYDNFAAAENEQFYGFVYNSTLDNQTNVTYTVNGVTDKTIYPLSGNGTIVISAPKDATIIANIQNNSLTQTIDLVNGKRTSTDLAQAWYEKNTVAKVTDGLVSVPVSAGEFNFTFKSSVTSADKTAATDVDNLGWADGGKKTWIVVTGDSLEFAKTGGSASTSSQKQGITLTDSKGATYKPANKNVNPFSDTYTVAFLVPDAAEKNYTIKLDASADVSDFGESKGTVSATSNAIALKF